MPVHNSKNTDIKILEIGVEYQVTLSTGYAQKSKTFSYTKDDDTIFLVQTASAGNDNKFIN